MKYRIYTLTLMIAAMLAAVSPHAFGQSSPPLFTNNPGTPGDGKWEINIGMAFEKLRDETLYEAPVLDINYGLGDRIQLKYEIPWLFLEEDGAETINGPGNSEIGLKYRFLDENPHGVSMSVYPLFSFNNPTSSDERGLVDPGMELVLPVQVVRRAGPIGLNLEFGYSLIEHSEDEWIYGLAAGVPLCERFDLLGEINGTSTRDFDSDILVFNVGGLFKAHQNVNLLFSIGRGLRGPDEAEPDFLGFAGLQFLF